jgi:hypothetical protein
LCVEIPLLEEENGTSKSRCFHAFIWRQNALGTTDKHHVKDKEQHGGIFAQAKRGDRDVEEMGERLKTRKEVLMAKTRKAQHFFLCSSARSQPRHMSAGARQPKRDLGFLRAPF